LRCHFSAQKKQRCKQKNSAYAVLKPHGRHSIFSMREVHKRNLVLPTHSSITRMGI
jgi:hypothetical protein